MGLMHERKTRPDSAKICQSTRAPRARADKEARRIPWQRLCAARNQYIDWQEFYLWVRSILELEGGIPDWLVETLKTRFSGFLENGSTNQ
jgi:hypothetical protein